MVPSPTVDFELNGEKQAASEPLTVLGLLQEFDLVGRRVAVAINAEVVPKSDFEKREVRAGDQVEVIQAVGGG